MKISQSRHLYNYNLGETTFHMKSGDAKWYVKVVRSLEILTELSKIEAGPLWSGFEI